MTKFIVYLCLCFPFVSFAQKEELKEWCKKMDNDYNGTKPLAVQYLMTVVGTAESPGKESLLFDLYIYGNKTKVVMGEAQDVVQDGNLVVIVNHVEKRISIGNEIQDNITQQSPLGDLSALVDSASNVTKKNTQNTVVYTLYYSKKFIYSVVRFAFNISTKQPISLYTEFNPLYPEPYYSMEINYKKWDTRWKPELGFPHVEKYIVKKGDRYQAQSAWKTYAFSQPH